MTPNIATTKEQSTRLRQCGVDPKTADMCWYKAKAANKEGYTWMLISENYHKSRNSDEFIPAWSLSTLLSLLPKEIAIDGYAYRISIYFENHDVPRYAPDLIECAVLMIEWLTANNYKLNQL